MQNHKLAVSMSVSLQPIIGCINDWSNANSLALLLEMQMHVLDCDLKPVAMEL
jgi:hypothetical protein